MSVVFGTNWKMRNVSPAEARAYVRTIIAALPGLEQVTLFVMPPATLIRDMAAERNGYPILIGAQNFHWAAEGEFTGEISTRLLRQEGAEILLAGHAERRRVFGESDQVINWKVLRALQDGFRVVLCVGDADEKLSERNLLQTFSIQLESALAGVTNQEASKILIAYEPLWAIGAGAAGAASPGRVSVTVEMIQQIIAGMFGRGGTRIPILYGGSVTLDNCQMLLTHTGLNGLFVGRAASNPKDFLEIVRRTLKTADRAGHSDFPDMG